MAVVVCTGLLTDIGPDRFFWRNIHQCQLGDHCAKSRPVGTSAAVEAREHAFGFHLPRDKDAGSKREYPACAKPNAVDFWQLGALERM